MPCTDENTRSGALLIDTIPDDSRNRELKPCDNFWTSPDLWLENANDPGTETGRAIVGDTMTVWARVHNIGKQQYGRITVEAWVCDYTAGPLPTGRLGNPGDLIGYQRAAIAPGAQAEIACAPTWRPDRAQLSINRGHVCIAANVYATEPEDGDALGAGFIRQCCNSHHAQRNIGISGADGDGLVRQMMRMQGIPGEKPIEALMEIFQVTDRTRFGEVERRLLKGSELARKYELDLTCERVAQGTLSGAKFKGEPRVEILLDPKRPQDVELQIAFDPGCPPARWRSSTRSRATARPTRSSAARGCWR